MTNQKDTDTPDRGIAPAETAARREREGSDFKKTADEQAGAESLDVTGGATVDQEGLGNNFAVEPEMYYEERGDAEQQESERAAERSEELTEVNESKEGELSEEGDMRGRGPGVI